MILSVSAATPPCTTCPSGPKPTMPETNTKSPARTASEIGSPSTLLLENAVFGTTSPLACHLIRLSVPLCHAGRALVGKFTCRNPQRLFSRQLPLLVDQKCVVVRKAKAHCERRFQEVTTPWITRSLS